MSHTRGSSWSRPSSHASNPQTYSLSLSRLRGCRTGFPPAGDSFAPSGPAQTCAIGPSTIPSTTFGIRRCLMCKGLCCFPIPGLSVRPVEPGKLRKAICWMMERRDGMDTRWNSHPGPNPRPIFRCKSSCRTKNVTPLPPSCSWVGPRTREHYVNGGWGGQPYAYPRPSISLKASAIALHGGRLDASGGIAGRSWSLCSTRQHVASGGVQ